MKVQRILLPLLLVALLLAACGRTAGQTDGSEITQSSTEASAPLDEPDTPDTSEEEVTEYLPSTKEPLVAEVASGRLMVLQSGQYSGLSPESGADAQVENVAALLVANISEETCQFCTLNYTIDGTPAVFQISELPAGKAVWVLEASQLTIAQDAGFHYESDISAFRAADAAWLPDVTATGDGGQLTVTNAGETDYPLVTVYYKLTYGENTYLGGIAYRITVDGLAAGESKTLTAGHFYAGACEIVGIYADGTAQ